MIKPAESIESTEQSTEDVDLLGDFPTLDMTGEADTQDSDAPSIADDGGEIPADLDELERLEHAKPAEQPTDDEEEHATSGAGIL